MQIKYFDGKMASVAEVKAYLDEWGFAVLRGKGDPVTMDAIAYDIRRYGRNVKALELEFFGGGALKKVEGLAAKSAGMIELIDDPFAIELAEAFLGAEPLLNASGGFILGKGNRAQPLHHDDVLYKPMVPRHTQETMLNFMFAVTDFTRENGCTRMVPGSHKWPEGRAPTPDDEVIDMVMEKGSVAIWLGSTWHGAGQNTTDEPRIGAEMGFNCGWLRPHESYHLMIPPGMARDLPVLVQEVLGYKAHRGMLGVIEQRSPSEVFGFNRHVAARAATADGKELKIALDRLEAWTRDHFRGREMPEEAARHFKRLAEINQQRSATTKKSDLDMLEVVGESQARALAEALQAAGLSAELEKLARPH